MSSQLKMLFGNEADNRAPWEDEVDQLIAGGALFIANHSGGKDSQVQLIRLLERVPASQLVVVHASLGPWSGRARWSWHVIKPPQLGFPSLWPRRRRHC